MGDGNNLEKRISRQEFSELMQRIGDLSDEQSLFMENTMPLKDLIDAAKGVGFSEEIIAKALADRAQSQPATPRQSKVDIFEEKVLSWYGEYMSGTPYAAQHIIDAAPDVKLKYVSAVDGRKVTVSVEFVGERLEYGNKQRDPTLFHLEVNDRKPPRSWWSRMWGSQQQELDDAKPWIVLYANFIGAAKETPASYIGNAVANYHGSEVDRHDILALNNLLPALRALNEKTKGTNTEIMF